MVVDDQLMVRAGIAAIVDAEDDLTVVGEAADGEAALALAAECRPDVVLMDIRMPGMDGITATARLTAGRARDEREHGRAGGEQPPRVLVLTTFHQDAYVFEALRAGASGFVLKDAEPADLLAAVRVVADGEAMLSPAVTRRLIDRFAAGTAPMPPGGPGGSGRPGRSGGPGGVSATGLTPRERDVLLCIATGLSNAEIGARLGITTGTVKVHVNALLAKLGVRDRVQATIAAYDMGLVRPNP